MMCSFQKGKLPGLQAGGGEEVEPAGIAPGAGLAHGRVQTLALRPAEQGRVVHIVHQQEHGGGMPRLALEGGIVGAAVQLGEHAAGRAGEVLGGDDAQFQRIAEGSEQGQEFPRALGNDLPCAAGVTGAEVLPITQGEGGLPLPANAAQRSDDTQSPGAEELLLHEL